jgi:hypothetical protein
VSSDPARDAALAKAAELRRVRAEVVDAVADGTLALSGVFQRSADHPMVAGIKILPVLEVVPGVGKVRARRLLEAAGIDEAERIDQLDEDRRKGLLQELDR